MRGILLTACAALALLTGHAEAGEARDDFNRQMARDLARMATAPKICAKRGAILEQLAKQHKETPQSFGLAADGGVLEVLVSPEGGWTMIVTYPGKPTCVLAVGTAWQGTAESTVCSAVSPAGKIVYFRCTGEPS